MAYMKDVPEDIAAKADWAICFTDGTCMPVHSTLLCTLSPVLAGLCSTKPAKPAIGRKYVVEIPMPLDKTKDIASVFLCWLYRQKIMWTLLVAKELAEIGHFWNISCKISENTFTWFPMFDLRLSLLSSGELKRLLCAVLPPECEDFLVAEAGKTPSFLRNIGAEDLLGWLDIADKCGDRFLPFCTAEFFLRGKVSKQHILGND